METTVLLWALWFVHGGNADSGPQIAAYFATEKECQSVKEHLQKLLTANRFLTPRPMECIKAEYVIVKPNYRR